MRSNQLRTIMKNHLLSRFVPTFLATILMALSASADVVYVTSNTSNCTSTAVCGNLANQDLNINGGRVFNDNLLSSFTTAVASTPDKPLNAGGARFFSISFSNTTPEFGLTLSPTLGVTGGVYKVYHVFSSTANNGSTNVILGVTNNDGCTLSFTETDKFQRRFGQPAPQRWQLLGFLTNNADTSTPTITFYFKDGRVSAGEQARLPVDTFRFSLYDPCTDVTDISDVGVTGPLAVNVAAVVVTGASNAATKITVYQNTGSGMVEIGSKTAGIVSGNNSVPVTGLVKGAIVGATQTLNGQEGCIPAGGVLVGGGANPTVKIALTIRETSSTGPVGSAGVTTNTALHFLGATTVSGGAPIDAAIVTPSTEWQTLTFNANRQFVGNASNAVGAVSGPGVYNPNDSVVIEVYAYRTVPDNGVLIYSPVAVPSTAVTSNNFFAVNWTWNAVAGAEGYRVLRNVNSAGFLEFTDVTANSLTDDNFIWQGNPVVTPKFTQLGSSIQWNPSVGNPNNIATRWGTLESINFVIDELSDTGPFDLYIDNLSNGTTNWQTFEEAVAGRTDYAFRAPTFSGTTSGNLLTAPNIGQVSNGAADTGTKSFRVAFQWNGVTASKWLRLTTSGAGNPQVNLDDPISFRLLLLPVGATPVAPPAPSLFITRLGSDTVLNWTGAHNLQASTEVTGTYTNIPNVTIAPYTNNLPDGQKFFRLAN